MRQQLVQRQAQRIDVAAGVALAFERLRRHVAQRAQDVAGVRQIVAAGSGHLGQAEVGDPHRAAHVQQQVGRLDVAVQDALLVGVFQGIGHLPADVGHALPVTSASCRRFAAPCRCCPAATIDEDETVNESESRPGRGLAAARTPPTSPADRLRPA